MPRNVQLPDGRILTIPDDATPDQLAALKNQLASRYANLKTGEGMEQRGAQQARSSLARDVQPNNVALAMSAPKQGLEAGLSSPAADPQNAAAMRTGAAIGATGAGVLTAPVATARAALGGAAGSYAGGHAAKYLSGGNETAESVGKALGGLTGGIAGGAGWNAKPGVSLFDLLSPQSAATAEAEPAMIPMTQSPLADEYAAIRAAQRATLRRAAAPVGTPGSVAQESGSWSPAVTRVPIRPEPSTPLNAAQVPGPDSSGRANLLSGLAKRGDPRAAAELLKRGRSVLYIADPAEGEYLTADDFAKLLNGIDQK